MRPPFKRDYVPVFGSKPEGERPAFLKGPYYRSTLPTKPRITQKPILCGLATPKTPFSLPVKPIDRNAMHTRFGAKLPCVTTPYNFMSPLGDPDARLKLGGTMKQGYLPPVRTY